MKIAVISNLFEPYQRGGAEKIAKIMADTLAENHDVFVVSSKPFVTLDSFKTSMDSYQASFGKEIKVYRYYPLNLFYYLNDFKYPAIIRLFWHIIDVFNWDSANQIAKILEAEKPEIVICHNLKGLGYMLPRKLKKMNIKQILVLHDVQYAVPSGLIIKDRENSFASDGLFTGWYQDINKLLLKNIDILISPSKWLGDFYKEKGFWLDKKIEKNNF